MCLFGVACSVGLFWFAGPRVFRDFWFERSIFVYGWNTGVVGTGIMLLRIVDPKFRSRTLEDYGVAYTALAPLEIAILVVLPPLVARGVVLVPALILVAIAAGCLLLARRLGDWIPGPGELPPSGGAGTPSAPEQGPIQAEPAQTGSS
jgi:ESS family glutamate:Na+ symporter